MKASFPPDLDDPDMTLIKFTTYKVNYWDSSSSKMIVVWNMFKAVVAGKEYAEDYYGILVFKSNLTNSRNLTKKIK